MPRLLVLAPLLLLPAACLALQIRGLDPSLQSYYLSGGNSFTCLDGLKTITHQHINDQFCDCFDGSDEPGHP